MKGQKAMENTTILPGLEKVVAEEKSAVERERGRQLTELFNRPPESIERQAGEMETKSPLFRGKGPQSEMF